MAYRYDSSTGGFVRTDGASPVSRRRPLQGTPSPAAAPVQPQAVQETPTAPVRKRRSARSSRREQAAGMTYNPSTGEFVQPRRRTYQSGSTASSTTRTTSSAGRDTESPTIVHRWGRTPFPERLQWFFSRVMTRVAVYIVAGFIISMCTRIFR